METIPWMHGLLHVKRAELHPQGAQATSTAAGDAAIHPTEGGPVALSAGLAPGVDPAWYRWPPDPAPLAAFAPSEVRSHSVRGPGASR